MKLDNLAELIYEIYYLYKIFNFIYYIFIY